MYGNLKRERAIDRIIIALPWLLLASEVAKRGVKATHRKVMTTDNFWIMMA